MTRRFTGWHMFAVLAAFFGTVIAVNFVMAWYATRTFGGTVVDNSYVASQEFNRWLAEARAQEKLGWTNRVALDADRHVMISTTAEGEPLAGLSASAVARHPLGRAADIPLGFALAGPGRLRSTTALPAGRWLVHLTVRSGSKDVRLIESLS
ncbi:MAG: FixH family protein [Proteobacteria bacterium]|nr:FixH family protein [Pseudomonadota bacterium]